MPNANGNASGVVMPAGVSAATEPSKRSFRYAGSVGEDHKQPLYCLQFCNVGTARHRSYFAAVGHNRASVYDARSGGGIDVVQAYVDSDNEEIYFTCAWTIDILTNDPLLVVAGHRGIIKILDCHTQHMVASLLGHGNAINDLKVHPSDLRLLLSVSKDESLRLWNLSTQVCIAVFAGDKGHRDEVLSADIHMLGTCVVSSGMDNTIKIWTLEEEEVVSAVRESHVPMPPTSPVPFKTRFVQFPVFSTSRVHSDYVDCVRWVGNLILSKSTGNKMVLWKPDTRRRKDAATILREYILTDADIWFVRFSLDEELRHVAVGNKKGKIFVWDVDAGPAEPPIQAKLSHTQCKSVVRQTAFSADGCDLLCCCDDGTVWRYTRPV